MPFQCRHTSIIERHTFIGSRCPNGLGVLRRALRTRRRFCIYYMFFNTGPTSYAYGSINPSVSAGSCDESNRFWRQRSFLPRETKEPLLASQACTQCDATKDNRRAIINTAPDAEAILRAGALLYSLQPAYEPLRDAGNAGVRPAPRGGRLRRPSPASGPRSGCSERWLSQPLASVVHWSVASPASP